MDNTHLGMGFPMSDRLKAMLADENYNNDLMTFAGKPFSIGPTPPQIKATTEFVHPGATFVIKRDLAFNLEEGLLTEIDGSELKPGALVMVGTGNGEQALASLQKLAERLVKSSSDEDFSERPDGTVKSDTVGDLNQDFSGTVVNGHLLYVHDVADRAINTVQKTFLSFREIVTKAMEERRRSDYSKHPKKGRSRNPY